MALEQDKEEQQGQLVWVTMAMPAQGTQHQHSSADEAVAVRDKGHLGVAGPAQGCHFQQGEHVQGSSSTGSPHSLAQQALTGSASPKHGQAGASPGTHTLLTPSTIPRAFCCHQASATPRGSRPSSPPAAAHAHTAQPCNANVLQVFIQAAKSSPCPKDTGAGTRGLQPSSAQQEQLPLLLSPQLGTAEAGAGGDIRRWVQEPEASGMSCWGISGSQSQGL